MTFTSTNNSLSIFKDGKLKPGIYKIQNLHNDAYVDIHEHSGRALHCRPAQDLKEGRGLWEIKPFGAGYTIQMVEPGKPEQFCAAMAGFENGSALSVSAYPVAWRIEVVNDDIHRGFEYVRFFWGTTNRIWDVDGDKNPNAKINFWKAAAVTEPFSWWIWRLIPVKVEGVSAPSRPSSETLGLGSLPSYDGNATGQSSTSTQHAESEHDDFGTIVTEVTTTFITTRKKYRVEDAQRGTL